MSSFRELPIESFVEVASASNTRFQQVSSHNFLDQSLSINLKELLVQVTGQKDTENISRVKIKVVTRDAGLHRLVDYTPRLRVLILDGSFVESLRDLGSELRNLETLSVIRCSLKSLDGVSGFRSLSALVARDNSIKDPSPCSLIHKLARLDLANNEIDDPGLFVFLQNCKHLRKLDVAGNFFDNYRNNLMTLVPQIRVLDGEDIEKTEPMFPATNAEEINESESDLTSEDEDFLFLYEDKDRTSCPVTGNPENRSTSTCRLKALEAPDGQQTGAGDVEANECEEKLPRENKSHREERNLDSSSSSIHILTHDFDRISMPDLNAIGDNHHQQSVEIMASKLSMSGRAICGNLAASLRARNSSKNPFTVSSVGRVGSEHNNEQMIN